MNKIACSLVLLLISSVVGFGQGTYNPVNVLLPQFAVGGDPGGDNYVTLLQLVNNNSVIITAHLTPFSDAGSPLAVTLDSQGPQTAWDISIAPGQARQIQLSLNGPVTAGWLLIRYSPSDALTTAIIQYRTGEVLRSEVGVDANYSALQSADVAVETDDTNGSAINVGVAIANPFSTPANVYVGLSDPDTGKQLAAAIKQVPAGGHIAQFLPELFPSVSNISHLRAELSLIACSTVSCQFIGSANFVATVLRLNGDQFTTIPVTATTTDGTQTRILPQVAFGGPDTATNMKTVLYFTTNVSTGVFGTADIFDDNGSPLAASANGAAAASSFTFTVPGGRVTRIVLTGDQTLRSGWIRLTLSGQVNLITSAIFQTFNGPNLVAEASVLESDQTTEALIYAKSQPGFSNVGIALANPGTDPNTVTLRLLDANGASAGTATVTLPPNGHLARFLTELFPDVAAVPDFDGTLAVSSSTTFSAVALRLSKDKLATLPVVLDGIYRPTIAAIRVSRLQRAPVQIDFAIDVADLDADAATAANGISALAGLDFGNGISAIPLNIDATGLLNQVSGTVSARLTPGIASVASGTQAILYLEIFDAKGHISNVIFTSIKF